MTGIKEHEGKKYLKKIVSAEDHHSFVMVDIYAVTDAFDVKCDRIAHAIKKLLMAGKRGKGDKSADLVGAIAAINRAIDREKQNQLFN